MAAVGVRLQHRQEGPHGVHHPEHVDVEQPAPVLRRQPGDRRHPRHTRVGADQMHGPEALDHRPRQGVQARRITHVDLQRRDAELGARPRQGVGLTVGQHDLHAFRLERAGKGEADSGGAAGYDGGLGGEIGQGHSGGSSAVRWPWSGRRRR